MDEERFADTFSQVIDLVVLLNADMTQALTREGLTVSRAHLIWELHDRGPCTQRVLADALQVSARTITGLVDGLEATGFVTREVHPTDRRATLVTFTERGAATAAGFRDGRRELAVALFGDMDPARYDGFTGGLTEVLAKLRAMGAALDEGDIR
jgi:DNA-binding MarR family transcriptional regulator